MTKLQDVSMAFLGDRIAVPQGDRVVLVPRRVESWLGHRAVQVPYAAIASLLLVQPPVMARGEWSIRLHDGTEITVGFPARTSRRMEQVHLEVLVTVLVGSGPAGTHAQEPVGSTGVHVLDVS